MKFKVDPEKLVKTVGKRIQTLRLAAGFSQSQFARELRCTTVWVQHLEQTGSNLTLHSVAKLASALGVKPADFFTDE